MEAICIDFGNTICKAACFTDGELNVVNFFTHQNALTELEKMIAQWRPLHSIISSVLKNDDAILQLLHKQTTCIELHHTTPLPFTMQYQTPETLGKDRLALVARAVEEFPKQNTLVIACGTCVTYNFVNDNAVFLGGAISLGLQMRLQAMQHFTQKLPLAENVAKPNLIGTTTLESLQSGAINGLCAEIDGIIAEYAFLYPKFNVVLTGGDMPQLALLLKSRIFADANFLFKGLYSILSYQLT